eukprot:GILK01013870.1.p1 GENE.GILK01013870.1~~GILK01013870.1.p1  ORF type:complete len:616 (-),score=93.76 GILK01013870.1:110-1957(-)
MSPSWLGVGLLLFFGGSYAAARLFFRLVAFPGSFFFLAPFLCYQINDHAISKFRDQLQDALAFANASVLEDRIVSLRAFIQHAKLWKDSLERLRQDSAASMTSSQRMLLDQLCKLTTAIQSLMLDDKTSLWDIVENSGEDAAPFQLHNSMDIVPWTHVTDCLQDMKALIDAFVTPKQKRIHRVRQMLDTPFATLPLLRARFPILYGATRRSVRTSDGASIDVMIVPRIPGADLSGGVMVIYCNPNGGLYEVVGYWNYLLNMYQSLGCNVVLFNYRGYGASSGQPTVRGLQLDGEAVYELVQSFRPQKIVVHGESMGGVAATHLACHRKVDFLLADRTFGSLTAIGRAMFGDWAGTLLPLVSSTKERNEKNFIQANCYKVTASDANDNIISFAASLTSAVAGELILNAGQADSGGGLLADSDLRSLHQAYRELITPLNNSNIRRPVQIDSHALTVLERAVSAIGMIDACNCSLADVLSSRLNLNSLKIFFASLQVWGSYSGTKSKPIQDRRSAIQLSLIRLQESAVLLSESAQVLNQPQLKAAVMELQKCLVLVRQRLSSHAESDQTLIDSKVGYFVNLTCGHNNLMSRSERQQIIRHMVAANIVDSNSINTSAKL